MAPQHPWPLPGDYLGPYFHYSGISDLEMSLVFVKWPVLGNSRYASGCVCVYVLSPSMGHEFPGVPQCAPPLPSIHAFQATLHLLYLAYLAHLAYLHVSCLEEEAMIRGGGSAPGKCSLPGA